MADYRYITLATETITWAAASGAELRIEMALVREESDYFGNGDYKASRDALAINTKSYIAGKRDSERDWIRPVAGRKDGVVASFGAIGIRQPQLDDVKAARARLEAHPEWAAKVEAKKRGEQADRVYRAHVKAVESAMTLNGRSY